MPELPEVQTTVNGLNRTVKGKKIVEVWTDYQSKHKMHQGSVNDKKFLPEFKKRVVGKKILKAERRAKNILIHLSNGETILVHMKMTGHFVFDKPDYPHIRLYFKLENDKTLYFSDMRRFAKVTLVSTKDLGTTEHLQNIGPEPLDPKFRIKNFESRIMTKPNGKIKTVLMDPSVVAGIGNIYSDEVLWRSGVHPLSIVSKIPKDKMREMFDSTKVLLKRGIDFGGDSMSDYRNIDGERGRFQEEHKAYRKTGERCLKKGPRRVGASCGGTIVRMVVGGRSAHFCDKHQRLYK
jgi:formamidopyrimidine-DNA glycosylase